MIYFAKWKIALIVLVIACGITFSIPNFFSKQALKEVPDWLPNKQINLGLDLQGGAHLAFQVEADSLVTERLSGLTDEVRTALRGTRDSRIRYTNLRATDKALTVHITDAGDMNEALKRVRALSSPVGGGLGGLGAVPDLEITTEEGNVIKVTLSEAAIVAARDNAVNQSIEIIRRRIDELGTLEPTIQRQGADRIIVQVPGETNPQRIIAIVGKTAKMNFYEEDTSVTLQEAMEGRVPPGSVLMDYDEHSRFAGGKILLKKNPVVSGEHLQQAYPSFDQRTGQPVVGFQFDNAGARRFGNFTRDHVGKVFAIVLDGKVITAPIIHEPIMSGSGQISGNFTVESANDLAILINAGALPAPLTPVEQRTVGAELGKDSIEAGKVAAVIGFVAVIAYMVLSYGLFGIFADIALVTNMILIAGALSMLQATLTLPGIAGVVLTIGMAVDANVLIFERIREEIQAGKTPLSAVEAGYQRAFGTILDANITTFIAAVILFQLGSGPVRGFAVTLAIGILTSVFTAFTFTRLLVAIWLKTTRPLRLPI